MSDKIKQTSTGPDTATQTLHSLVKLVEKQNEQQQATLNQLARMSDNSQAAVKNLVVLGDRLADVARKLSSLNVQKDVSKS